MKLLLIRHGETALNVARVLQPAATPLSERGIAQAEALARRLATMDVRAILSSDLPRALRTAEAIAATTGASIETTPLLQERNFGDWRGLSYDALAIDPMTMVDAPPGGESAAAFARRVAAAFDLIVQRQAALGGVLAVVTHGLVLPSSCRNGSCRACLCRLISGHVSYRIEWPGLSADEKAEGFILPCVAHPASVLEIDAPRMGLANPVA